MLGGSCYTEAAAPHPPKMRKMEVEEMNELKKEELKRMLDAKEDFALVNVLPEQYFNREHIPGSINVSVHDPGFLEKFMEAVPDKARKVVVYCASFECTASPTAAAKLRKAGYKNVLDYEGGIKGWKEAGYPLQASR